MSRFIESLRDKLEEQTKALITFNENGAITTNQFIDSVTNTVLANAGTVLKTYEDTGLAISGALTAPWSAAAQAITGFSEGDALKAMNAWTQEGGVFATFSANATTQLKSPFEAGATALNTFKQSVDEQMDAILQKINSNVDEGTKKLSSLTSGIQDTDKGNPGTTQPTQTSSQKFATGDPSVKVLQNYLNENFGANLVADGVMGPQTIAAIKDMQGKIGVTKDGVYGKNTVNALNGFYKVHIGQLESMSSDYNVGPTLNQYKNAKKNIPVAIYAKGTLGTKRDEFAITDEPWIGDELTMYATSQGTLSFMRAGSTVIPADLTKELMAIGEVGLDGLTNMPKFNSGVNINMISNAVTKPEFNLSFDALVKAGTISQDTLPEVKKFVQQEINNLVKQMNYSIKKFK